MRQMRWTLGLPALALAIACGEGSFIPSVGVDLDIPRQTIKGFLEPPFTNCDQLSELTIGNPFAPFVFRLRDAEELQGQDIVTFKNVVLEKHTLDTVDPAPGGEVDNWDFVDSVKLYADRPDDDKPRVLVAELDSVPTGVTRIVIPGTGVDISDIASADSFTVSGEVTGRPPCDNVNFVGQADFDVTVF
jgi:hypothetical protein